MQKWEYTKVVYTLLNNASEWTVKQDGQTLEPVPHEMEFLKTLGDQGWELVSISFNDWGYGATINQDIIYYFKRPKP